MGKKEVEDPCRDWCDTKRGPPHKEKYTPEQRFRLLRFYALTLFAVRIISAFVVRTQFVPDEAWQSTEVAHKIIFGYGHLSWEWGVGLRSYLYPILVGFPMQFLQLLNLDTPYLIVLAPRLVQAVLTAIGEVAFLAYAMRRYGVGSSKWIFALSLTSWFTFFCGSRTLTNSAEMALNMMAFYLLDTVNLPMFAFVVTLAFFIRPTAVILWLPLSFKIGCYLLRNPPIRALTIITGASVLIAIGVLDSWMYGRPILTPWNFFKFNFLEGGSANFGTHPALWYFYSGLPSVLGPHMITALLPLLFRGRRWLEDLQIIGVYIGILSLIAHKEIRFLLPLLPTLHAIIGDFAHIVYKYKLKRRAAKWGFLGFFIVNGVAGLVAMWFFGRHHQAGLVPATEFINQGLESGKKGPVWILMPCYSLPVFTYFHNSNTAIEHFTCHPNGQGDGNVQLGDFADLDLNEFVRDKISHPPQFVLLYDQSVEMAKESLKAVGLYFRVCFSAPHTPFPFDNIGTFVKVLCRD